MGRRPQRLSRYRLVRELGRGGMGVVWEAVLEGASGFRKPVALKLLHEVLDPGDAEALAREARLGALLCHPNIVGVLELGCEDGRWFVAMDLVRGTSLAEIAQPGPVPADAVLDAGLQVCAGLAHLHALRVDGAPAGLVHRDLKPSNLLVDRAGIVRIADLGIAAIAGTSGGAGTPGWMAPEQVAGGRVGPATDLFALGLVLARLALGRPILGRGPAAIEAVMRVERVVAELRVAAAADAVAAGLGAVLTRCLRADPARRWPDATSLADALRQVRSRIAAAPGLPHLVPATSDDPPTEPATTRILPTAGPTNLTPPADRSFGRDDDAAAVGDRLGRGARLVVLTGPGGIGKTRLAREAALASPPGIRRGGAWFVDLAATRDAAGACSAVAAALGANLGPGDPIDGTAAILRGRGAVLLVLDNLEQMEEAAREAIARWMRAVPTLTVLATSRVPLGLPEEQRVDVGPLSSADAVRLLCDRAPGPIDPAAADVVALAAALDGLPLAIELAAARLRAVTPGALLARMSDRFRLLVGGGADRPDRHRTLAAAIGSSWDLLPEWARTGLAQLSVFAGPFSLEAAEAVLRGDRWAVDVLDELVRHSLLRVVPGERFALFDTIRAFAGARLAPADRAAAEIRHGEHYAALGARHGIDDREPVRRRRAEQLHADREQVASALLRALERDHRALAVPLGIARLRLLDRAGPASETLALCDRLLATDPDPLGRGSEIQVYRAVACRAAGDTDEALAAFERARALAVRPVDVARVYGLVGIALWDRGDIAGARRRFQDAIARTRELGDRWALGTNLCYLGRLEHGDGRLDEAGALLEEAVELVRAEGDPRTLGVVLNALGDLRAEEGRLDEGLAHLRSALAALRSSGTRRMEAPLLLSIAGLLVDLDRPEESQAALDEAVASAIEVGDLRTLGFAELELAGRALAVGDRGVAARHIDRARDCLSRTRDLRLTVAVRVIEGDLALGEGRLEDAGRLLVEAAADADRLGHSDLLRLVSVFRAEWHAARGDREAALDELSRVTDLRTRSGLARRADALRARLR